MPNHSMHILALEDGVNLFFAEGEGKANGFVNVNGIIGPDNVTNLIYKNVDLGIRNLFTRYGYPDNPLRYVWTGAVLFEQICNGAGVTNAPIILDQVLKRINGPDGLLFGNAGDQVDPKLEDQLTELLLYNGVTVSKAEHVVVWRKFT